MQHNASESIMNVLDLKYKCDLIVIAFNQLINFNDIDNYSSLQIKAVTLFTLIKIKSR